MSPRLDIASDLSLGSDHRLLTLSFSFAQSSASESMSDTTDTALHPRRLWNLSRLGEPDPCQLYQDTFRSSSAALLSRQGQKIGPGDRWPQLSSDLHETPHMHSCTPYHL
ncbi:hypothetical protein G6F60_013904 [Rhizopus arrhizus]|nr:hypothetical protein G6F60_013904 [Rhizopus arrhizus]